MTNKNIARRQLKNVALFEAEDEASPSSNSLPIAEIQLPSQQPRRYFDPEKQQSLINSIKQHGILEPLLVRPLGEKYELIAGERRYRAAQALNLPKVPVVIREMTDPVARQVALIENLQREDLNAIEETTGILQLLGLELNLEPEAVKSLLYQLKNQQESTDPEVRHNVMPNSEDDNLQKVVGVFESLGTMSWLSFVQNRLPLLKLPAEILAALERGEIAYTKAQAIARIKDEEQRVKVLNEAITEDLSLTQIKALVAEQRGTQPKASKDEVVDRLNNVYRQVKKAKVWKDPQKQKKLIQALEALEILLKE